MNSLLILFVLLIPFSASASEINGTYAIFSNQICVANVTQKANLLLFEFDHNLYEGYYCSDKRTEMYECSSSSDLTDCKNSVTNSFPKLTYFPNQKIVIKYIEGINVYSKIENRYKAPHQFIKSYSKRVFDSEQCSNYVDEAEATIIKLCNKFTQNCKLTYMKSDQAYLGHGVLSCHFFMTAEGDPVI